jgi:RNAse (barnase) inhibitor barstar
MKKSIFLLLKNAEHGLYQWTFLPPEEADFKKLHDDNIRVGHVDLTEITSKERLFARFKESLDIPDFFGKNWDALWDVLCGEYDLLFLEHVPINPHMVSYDLGTFRSILEELPQESPMTVFLTASETLTDIAQYPPN